MKFDTPPVEEIEAALPTIDSYAASQKQKQQEIPQDEKILSAQLPADPEGITTDDPAALEQEADSQGAFNPVTGEINWDCPCLGGMAHGPCGQEFRNAFSCFVYSEQEPKGLDCIDKFKGMQDCFREHPEVYAAELDDDDELDAELAKEKEEIQRQAASARKSEQPQKRLLDDDPPSQLPISPILSADAPPSRRDVTSKPQSRPKEPAPEADSSETEPRPKATISSPQQGQIEGSSSKGRAEKAKEEAKATSEKFDEDLSLMPKAWHDTSDVTEPTPGENKSKD